MTLVQTSSIDLRAGSPGAALGSLSPSQSSALDRYKWAANTVRELLRDAPSRVVADIGAGGCQMRPFVEQSGGDWYGFDLNPQNELVRSWDLDRPAPPDTPGAGLVLMLEVVEHLKNPWRAMQHVADVLLPGGFLVLTTPNPRWSRSRMHALAFGVPVCFRELDMTQNHHVFTPWPHIVHKLLDDVGLDVCRYDTIDGHTEWPGRPLNHRYPVRFALALVNRFLEHRDPSAKGMAYAMIARKRR
jgi:SAM-dependent methyltransferase